jgi:hypothetical protein
MYGLWATARFPTYIMHTIGAKEKQKMEKKAKMLLQSGIRRNT